MKALLETWRSGCGRAVIHTGDCLKALRLMPDRSVQCCVTSPPYWGLRDYQVVGQIGLEARPALYVARLRRIFREVRRVLAEDGTLWLNLGDCYSAGGRSTRDAGSPNKGNLGSVQPYRPNDGLKPKDLIGMPWRVAFALQADGWFLRSDIIWSKPNPMPESVTDRPTRAHEYLFLMTKSARYFYDAEAIAEPLSSVSIERLSQPILEHQNGSDRVPGKTNGNMKAVGKLDKQRGHGRRHAGFNDRWDAMEKAEQCSGMRNKRSVWSIATQSYKEAHFATFPRALVEPCVLAGSRVGDWVLDPFLGSGTSGEVALALGRKIVGIELNPEYVALARERMRDELVKGEDLISLMGCGNVNGKGEC